MRSSLESGARPGMLRTRALRLGLAGALCVSTWLSGVQAARSLSDRPAPLAPPGLPPPGPSMASRSPLADAAMRGDRSGVRRLLTEGADASAAQGDGMTALHWAAERGDAELAAMLLNSGASVAAVTRIGHYTPLHVAARAGSPPVARLLLDAAAAVDARTDPGGATPLHLAAESGNVDLVAILVARGADVDAREAVWGQTPLMFAASMNRAAAITVLLEYGADHAIATKTIDLARQQALDRAATERQKAVLDASVSKGLPATPTQVQAAIQAARELYASGKIPAPAPAARAQGQRGAGRGQPASAATDAGGAASDAAPQPGADDPADAPVNTYISTAEDGPLPPIAFKGGLTALLHAARQGYLEAARALLDGGADVNQVAAGDGTSPLLMSIINGEFDLAMLLIERGANPNLAATGNGAAPLWSVINTEWQPRTRFPQPQEMDRQHATYLDVMQALLDAGADPNARLKSHPWYMVYNGCGNRNCGLADTSGSTPFWRAAYATDEEAMRLLVAYGADPNIPTVVPPPQRDRFGRGGRGGGRGGFGRGRGGQGPDQGQGQDRGLGQGQDRGQGQGAVLEELPGLPPVPIGGPAIPALHAAAGVEYGQGFAGNAHRHVPGGWLPAVKYLVEELGVDVNARDQDGYTPLHHAAARGDNEMILYLVSKGADVTAISRRGQTTADMANGPVQRLAPFPETVALLEKLGSKNNHRCVSC